MIEQYNQDEIDIKEAAFDCPYYFTKVILGYDLLTDRIHKPIFDFINQPLPGMDKELADIEPRDTFKTTCISIGYPLWRIVKNRNIRILLNHKIRTKSKAIINTIKEHIERNENFRYFFGDLTGGSWTKDGFVVNGRKTIKTEPTLTPGGVDHEMTSAHFDLIINDDLPGLKDMYSEAAREQALRYYKSLKFLRDRGSFDRQINAMTRWALDDLGGHIIKTLPKDHVRIRSALLPNNKSYFPERYTAEELIKERNDDPVFFESQRQNNPTASADQLYDIDDLNKFHFQAFIPEFNVAFVDPALGKKESKEPCFFCLAIGSIVGDQIYIVEWITNKLKPKQNTILIIEKCKEYKMKMLGFESNAAQSIWGQNVKDKLKEENMILSFIDYNQSGNKDRRIQAMHGAVVNNTLFREDWDIVYPEAMNQLLLYPHSKFKDAPDALEGLITMTQINNKPAVRRL